MGIEQNKGFSTGLKWGSILGFVVLVLAMLGLMLRHSFFGKGLFAIALQVLSIAFMLWARLAFGLRSFHATANPTEGDLVTVGPYRFLRHPIYSAILYFLWAGALSHISIVSCLLALVATATLVARIAAEEKLLVKRYPEYATYAAKTKRVIPFMY